MTCAVFYHRATHCGHRTGREDELIRFGVGRAEKAIDNALGGDNAAVDQGRGASMQMNSDKSDLNQIIQLTQFAIKLGYAICS